MENSFFSSCSLFSTCDTSTPVTFIWHPVALMMRVFFSDSFLLLNFQCCDRATRRLETLIFLVHLDLMRRLYISYSWKEWPGHSAAMCIHGLFIELQSLGDSYAFHFTRTGRIQISVNRRAHPKFEWPVTIEWMNRTALSLLVLSFSSRRVDSTGFRLGHWQPLSH